MLSRVSPEEIIEAYRLHGSVWKAGAALGIAGQTVHKWLKKSGVPTKGSPFSEAEKEAIANYYTTATDSTFDLAELADKLNRPRTGVCRIAATLGLTRLGRETAKRRVNVKAAQQGMWSRNPHPRGMAGKKHTPETLELVSVASRRNWATWKAFELGPMAPTQREENRARLAAGRAKAPPERLYTRAKGGRRPDLGDTFFRSSWEANYARYLNLLMKMGVVISWEFEPETFWFEGIKRGVCSYKPDFKVFYKDDPIAEYVELKGWITAKDRTKWRRMKKYHPHIKLVVVAAKEYAALYRKWASSIPHWEGGKAGCLTK